MFVYADESEKKKGEAKKRMKAGKEKEKIKNQLGVNAGRDEAYFFDLEFLNHPSVLSQPQRQSNSRRH